MKIMQIIIEDSDPENDQGIGKGTFYLYK